MVIYILANVGLKKQSILFDFLLLNMPNKMLLYLTQICFCNLLNQSFHLSDNSLKYLKG